MTSRDNWKDISSAKRQSQFASIPQEWIIELPPNTQDRVLDVPAQSGLLTPKELEITETTEVDILLKKLSSAEWSSVEVTTAFYKRAVIAHQVVRLT